MKGIISGKKGFIFCGMFITVLLLALACNPYKAPPATTTPPVATTAGATPILTITTPTAGASLPEGNVTVSIAVQNFELVAPGGANTAGKGHVHYYLDVTIPTAPGAPATTAPGTYKATPGTSATWDNVNAGTHTLGVQLVNNNHTPLSQPVTATVTVTVTAQAAATTTPPATTAATAAPTVTITAPASGASLPAGGITVNIAVQHFELVAPGGANAAGKGHIHYYLDADIPTTAGAPATTAPGTYKATPGTSVTWDGVTAGTHTFGVQLVNNNHTPLSPPVTTKITVTVTAPATTTPPTTAATAPTLTITSPPAGATVAAGSITVTIAVQNFELVAPGGANTAGKGHVHYYLDVTIPTAPGAPATTAAGTYKASPASSVTWDGVTAGTHTFSVQLVNNDHTPLSTPVTAQITVTVSDTGGTVY